MTRQGNFANNRPTGRDSDQAP
ncbi:MAG: hypothetical protein EZS28_048248, partial [Streblomastix strix]